MPCSANTLRAVAKLAAHGRRHAGRSRGPRPRSAGGTACRWLTQHTEPVPHRGDGGFVADCTQDRPWAGNTMLLPLLCWHEWVHCHSGPCLSCLGMLTRHPTVSMGLGRLHVMHGRAWGRLSLLIAE